MKIRNDFVSNSSSCSFIITEAANIEKTYDVINEIFSKDDEVPYDMDLNVYVRAKNKDLQDLSKALTGYIDPNFKMEYIDYDTKETIKKDPEEEGWDSIQTNISQLLNFMLNRKNKNKINKITRIEFECDDYEADKRNILAVLFTFFKRHNCNPDAYYSEHDFLNNNNSPFLNKLMN